MDTTAPQKGKIGIIDTTLSTGGQRINWRFGEATIRTALELLLKSNMDIVECGMLCSYSAGLDCAIYESTYLPEGIEHNNNQSYSLQLDTYSRPLLTSIPNRDQSTVDIIRLFFTSENVYEDIEYSCGLTIKGYDVTVMLDESIWLESATLESRLEIINTIHPRCCVLCDRSGLMNEAQMTKTVSVMLRQLDNDIAIGFQGHNSLQSLPRLVENFLSMMLHDDDLLMSNALKTMGFLIRGYDTEKQPVGAIAASYVQVEYDPIRDEIKEDIPSIDANYAKQPVDMRVYHLTHTNVKVFAHIGGAAPTNGSTFRRQAVIDVGGFNETHGISGDLMLFYRIENKYMAYQTLSPIGFYRWGINSMMNKDSLRRVIQDNFDYREYIYQKSTVNRLWGRLFRSCHYKRFSKDAINERVKISGETITLDDFNNIYNRRPNVLWYICYELFAKVYGKFKNLETRRNAHNAIKRIKNYYTEELLEVKE